MLLSLQASELGEVLGKAGVGCRAEQGLAFLCSELPGAWAAHRAAAPLFRLCFNKSFTPSNSLDDFFPYRGILTAEQAHWRIILLPLLPLNATRFWETSARWGFVVSVL